MSKAPFDRRPRSSDLPMMCSSRPMTCALAPTIEALIFFRLMQAVGSCAGVTLGRAVARDLYPPAVAARVAAGPVFVVCMPSTYGPRIKRQARNSGNRHLPSEKR